MFFVDTNTDSDIENYTKVRDYNYYNFTVSKRCENIFKVIKSSFYDFQKKIVHDLMEVFGTSVVSSKNPNKINCIILS